MPTRRTTETGIEFASMPTSSAVRGPWRAASLAAAAMATFPRATCDHRPWALAEQCAASAPSSAPPLRWRRPPASATASRSVNGKSPAEPARLISETLPSGGSPWFFRNFRAGAAGAAGSAPTLKRGEEAAPDWGGAGCSRHDASALVTMRLSALKGARSQYA